MQAGATAGTSVPFAREEEELARALRLSVLQSEEDEELQRVLKLSLLDQSASKPAAVQHERQKQQNAPAVFLFVSRTAGGNLGQRYLDLCSEAEGGRAAVHFKGLATVWIYDIAHEVGTSDGGFEKAIRHATREQSGCNDSKVRVIACGGDGTVSWMVGEMRKRVLPSRDTEQASGTSTVLDSMVFGVLPLGTGNDFSRTFDWGGDPPEDLMHSDLGFLGLLGGLPEAQVTRLSLERSVRLWLSAEVTRHDLWTIEVRTCSGGDFVFVSGGRQVHASTDASLRERHQIATEPTPMMRKPLLNYYSFGYESKVGLGFDKHRTGHAGLNQVVYGAQGLWEAGKAKVGGDRAARVCDVLREVAVVENLDGEALRRRSVVVTTLDRAQAAAERMPAMVGDPLNLLVLNTRSIVKGKDVWGGTREVLQVDMGHVKYHHTLARQTVYQRLVRGGGRGGEEEEGGGGGLTVVEVEAAREDLGEKEQQLGDGMLYFVTYQGISSFVGDIAHAELFGAHASRGQRLWYGPERVTRPAYEAGPGGPGEGRVEYVELAFKEARQPLSLVCSRMLRKDGRARGAVLPSSSRPAEACLVAAHEPLSRGDAEQVITNLRGESPGEGGFLRAVAAQVRREFPEYCNRLDVVYMQVDGEYFAVRWPRTVRISHDGAVNVLRRRPAAASSS